MLRSFAALAVLAVTLQGVLSFKFLGIDFGHNFEDDSGLERVRRDVGDGKPCTWSSFERAFQCCKFPPVVPDGTLKTCIASTLKRKTKVGAKRIPGMSFACTVDCALRKNEMILDDGNADIVKLEETFLAKADKTWKPVVSSAVDKCKEEMTKTNITEEGECKLANLHLMYCLFREVTTNCPVDSVPETAEGCDSKVSTIENCDPWSVMKDVESKVSSSLNKAGSFLKNNNPFPKFADRFKNVSSKSVMEKVDKVLETATGNVGKMVQSAKKDGKSFADKAKQFFAKAKQSLNTDN